MDYLISEGYPAAAKKFASEANLSPPDGDYQIIEDRVKIRSLILEGNIQPAIEMLNDLDATVSTPLAPEPLRDD